MYLLVTARKGISSMQLAKEIGVTQKSAWFMLLREACGDDFTKLIQDGRAGQLLPPSYWIAELSARRLLRPGTVLLSGTIPMIAGVDQFADGWRVELADPSGEVSRVRYDIERLAEAWD